MVHFIEDDAEGVDVHLLVVVNASYLLMPMGGEPCN